MTFIASRSDFTFEDAPVGLTAQGKTVKLPPISFWHGGRDGEVAFCLSPEGIHISPADDETLAFVNVVARHFGAIVQAV